MRERTNNHRLINALVGASIAVCAPFTTYAAPGALADKPLNLASGVQPNIMFLLDNSGSMDMEIMLRPGAVGPIININDEDVAVLGDDWFYNNSFKHLTNPPDANSTYPNLQKRMLCNGYNVMAYNPDMSKIKYTPWVGEDKTGQAYQDLDLTTARANPYDPATITDISTHVFYRWSDSNNNNHYDGPGSTNGNNASTTGDECDLTNPVSVSSLSAAEQKNYANWWSYYRKREYVMKRAMSQIIDQAVSRMGIKTINPNTGLTAPPVADMLDPSNTSVLMSYLFQISSHDGTPLRTALEDVGEYFSGTQSPILPESEGGQCQQNFALVMSDGYWNGGSPSVGNADGDNTSNWDGGSHADTISNTLADVAMKYYETDLKPLLPNRVPVIGGVDENSAQHLVTYSVAFGVNGTLTANPPNRASAFSWPDPTSGTNDAYKIDDMRHAAWNGRGQFLDAGNPGSLISKLNSAISNIVARSGSDSGVAVNSPYMANDSLVFVAQYDTSTWNSTISAYAVTDSGVAPTSTWNTTATLSGIDPASRSVYVYNGNEAVPFVSGNLTTAQKADLLTDKPASETDDQYLTRIIAFLRGDHSNEVDVGGLADMRKRNGFRLGDVVHASPVFVGKPGTPYPNAIEGTNHLYSDFVQAQENRAGTVYVASNDGMLHAFDATSGEERFAYIPQLVFSDVSGRGLHALARPTYEHKYFLDATPTVEDVFINDKWRTVLVGGQRGGGKGIYALDITTEGQAKTLFELTHLDLGYTFSEIAIGKLNNGHWAALLGNGYNNSGDGSAKLFIVYLDDGSYRVIETGVGSISNGDCGDAASNCNGLSSPVTADLNGDAVIDRVYAGDAQGNLWAFDLSSSNAADWKIAHSDNGFSKPLFTAPDHQPITAKPAISRHDTQRAAASYPNIMVMFGTGQYLNNGDVSNADQQAFYGVWDSGKGGLDINNLVAQQISESTESFSSDITNTTTTVAVRKVTNNSVSYTTATGSDYGWYTNLPTAKERVIVAPIAYGKVVLFLTYIPLTSQSCSGSEGIGWLMALNITDGSEPDFTVFDVNNDNAITAQDQINSTTNVSGLSQGVTGDLSIMGDGLREGQLLQNADGTAIKRAIQGLPPVAPSRSSWTTN